MKFLGNLAVRFAFFLCVSAMAGNPRVFNVLDFGAAGDGTTLDTIPIQRAIDAAAVHGGQVRVPRGRRFLIGSLELRGGIDFHLEGKLVISTNQRDYKSDGVITALNTRNLRITGQGEIDGRSVAFMKSYDNAGEWWLFKEWRPKLFVLTGCSNLLVRGITFGDAPFWGLHLLGCTNVLVENITVRNRLDVPNCDGIDPDHCQDVEIRNCRLTCGDDAIVIKTTRQTNDYGPCANIRVHDCVIRTQDAGLKIGTETVSDIHDIVFENCRILSGSRGMTIQLRDEGNVSNIVFRDIRFVSRYHADPWWGRGEAISFTAIPRTSDTRLGSIRNVLVRNVRGRAENSVRINGSAGSIIRGVHFQNVSITFDRWTKYPGGVFDNRPTKVLEPIEKRGNPAYSIRWAADITLENCAVHWGTHRPAYFDCGLDAENVDGLRLTGFRESGSLLGKGGG
jgi:polygalacturonase